MVINIACLCTDVTSFTQMMPIGPVVHETPSSTRLSEAFPTASLMRPQNAHIAQSMHQMHSRVKRNGQGTEKSSDNTNVVIKRHLTASFY